MEEKKYLLCGLQKTGSTWCRFVIFNYFNILNRKATKTLNFEELREIHLRRGFYPSNKDPKKPNNPLAFIDGYHLVYHTHLAYNGTGFMKVFPEVNKWFEEFDGLIYIYRNPFDTMISYFEFLRQRDEIPYMNTQKAVDMVKTLSSLEEFTKFYLCKWISHVKSTMHRADVILNYDALRISPLGFLEAIQLINGAVDIEVFDKAVQMSSFGNIRKMSEEVGQIYGVGGPLYKGYFCRDGRTGQYKEVMSIELIDYIKEEVEKAGLKI